MVSGIVLKNYYPHRSKLIILSSAGERLDLAVVQSNLIARIHPGYRVQFLIELVHGVPKITALELLGAFQITSWQQLNFLQQILNLCVFGVMPGTTCLVAVNLLNLLLQTPNLKLEPARQRLFVCHLLAVWGSIPELLATTVEQVRYMYQIGQLSLVDLQIMQINEAIERLLVSWIGQLVQQYDGVKTFGLIETVMP
jgi:hypothetical protein